MRTIGEIFETNPALLETKEVKELVEQFKLQFQAIKTKHYNYWNPVTELVMNSEIFVINGTPYKKVIEKISNISFESKYIAIP